MKKPDLVVGSCGGTLYWSKDLVSVQLVHNSKQGNGDFGKWVKELEKRAKGMGLKKVWFPTPSLRLAETLLRNGYHLHQEYWEEVEETVTILEKFL